MSTQQIPPFHNPQNLTPEAYGASEGWRLLRVTELEARPKDSEYADSDGSFWRKSHLGGGADHCSTYRTRTPDSYVKSEEWNKTSDGWPKPSDYPLDFYNEKLGVVPHIFATGGAGWTHWKSWPAHIPPPPPARELTQAERDQKAHDDWIDNEGEECTTTTGIWHAALAYERARTGGK